MRKKEQIPRLKLQNRNYNKEIQVMIHQKIHKL